MNSLATFLICFLVRSNGVFKLTFQGYIRDAFDGFEVIEAWILWRNNFASGAKGKIYQPEKVKGKFSKVPLKINLWTYFTIITLVPVSSYKW